MRGPLCYAGSDLDRAAHLRRDSRWLEARYRDPCTRVVPIWKDDCLVAADDSRRPLTVTGERCAVVLDCADHVALLGVAEDGSASFAADLSGQPESDLATLIGVGKKTSLRRVGPVMSTKDAALLAYARGILQWHRRHRFCGTCGSPTAPREAGHIRMCCREQCAAEHFPRTDPAVIMLVTTCENGEARCLLGRHERWPRGMYSTLAGFVEPGETLEDAVVRECREETGVIIAKARYRASQPWPFPSSIMLGFRAEAEGATAIAVDRDELQDARWFTRTEVAEFASLGLKLPSADSIARWLVEEWLEEAP